MSGSLEFEFRIELEFFDNPDNMAEMGSGFRSIKVQRIHCPLARGHKFPISQEYGSNASMSDSAWYRQARLDNRPVHNRRGVLRIRRSMRLWSLWMSTPAFMSTRTGHKPAGYSHNVGFRGRLVGSDLDRRFQNAWPSMSYFGDHALTEVGICRWDSVNGPHFGIGAALHYRNNRMAG